MRKEDTLEINEPQPAGQCGLSADTPDQGTCGGVEGSPLTAEQMRDWRSIRSAMGRLLETLNRDLLDSVGISLSEYEILVHLDEAEENRLRMSSLAEQVGQSRSRLTHTVARLEKRGWMTRFTCDSDKRGVHCKLTEAGQQFLNDAAPGHLSSVKDCLVDQYSAEEFHDLASLMSRVV